MQTFEEETPAEIDLNLEAPAGSLSQRARNLARQLTMTRYKGAYGKRARVKDYYGVSQWGPVDFFHYDEVTGSTII